MWHGRQLATSRSWIRRFSPRQPGRLRADVERVRHKDFTELAPDDFGCAELIDEIRSEVLHGRGFILLRGIDPSQFSMGDLARLFCGLGLRLGRLLPQNAKGHTLGHIKDLGVRSSDPAVRLYQTNERQFFHTDSCDIVALLCLSKARVGGLSGLASTWTAYNEMLRRRPDLCRTLFEPIWTDHRGEHPPGSNPWFSIPLLSWHRERLLGMYQRRYIESGATESPD